MAVLDITKGAGGTSIPAEMTVIPPSAEASIEALRAVGRDAGLDGVAVADALSALAEHERQSARFQIAAARQSRSPELTQLHAALAHAHMAHLRTLETLMSTVGLSPLYAGPGARMSHHAHAGLIAAPLLAGSVGPASMEYTLLAVALVMAENCEDSARSLVAMAGAAKPGATANALRTAAERLRTDLAKTLEHVRSTKDGLVVAAVKPKSE